MLLPHPRALPTTNLSRQHGPGTCSGHTPDSSLLISKCCYQRVLRPLPLPLVATVWMTPASIIATLATAPPPLSLFPTRQLPPPFQHAKSICSFLYVPWCISKTLFIKPAPRMLQHAPPPPCASPF
jgi:hypothetical protein